MSEEDTLRDAFREAQFAGLENGMATKPIYVEGENVLISVMRKSVSLDHPRIYLVRIEPKTLENEPFVDESRISEKIKNALDLYGDIEFTFKGNFEKTCVIDANLVTIPPEDDDDDDTDIGKFAGAA